MPSSSSSSDEAPATGKSEACLYIVGTPIGNLSDITLRAIEVLKRADRILAEDTRHSRHLLTHFGITSKPMACIEAHVSDARLEGILQYLAAGETLALVTDAGMPAVSDPGAKLVSLARAAGYAVEVVPGPSALTAAIALSGLVEGPFYFGGFLPRQGGKRARAIDRVCLGESAAVLFEAPGRVQETLADLAERLPERRAAVCREITKLHEEVVEGTLAELCVLRDEWRGEVVIVLADPGEIEQKSAPVENDEDYRAKLESGKTVKDLVDASGKFGKARRELYAHLLELKRKLDE
jgi:16S rRNA (cytidine1402-2'-O)-methyltransferase